MRSRTASLLRAVFGDREARVFVPVYFFLSLSNLVLKIRMTPYWTSGLLVSDHNALLAFQSTNNEQSRLLQFLIPELLRRTLSLSIISSYAFARLFFVFMAFLVFHKYLRKWFGQGASYAGVLILSGSMALTFLKGDLQESAPLLMLMFVLGLWAIREENDLFFALFLLVGGGLTNETMLILAAGHFFYRLRSGSVIHVLRNGLVSAAVSLPAFLTQGVIRYINRSRPHLGGAYHLPDNVLGIWGELRHPVDTLYGGSYVYPLLIFSIFWVYAMLGYSRSPRFLKSVFWIVPLFVAAHLITGIISEPRQMIPLAYILIPMSFFFIFPQDRSEAQPALMEARYTE